VTRFLRRSFFLLPFGSVTLEQKISKVLKVVNASDLVVKLGVDDQMEVVIDFLDLSKVFVLHLASCFAFGAVLGGVREKNLVDDDVMDIDLLLGKFNSKSLGLVHRQELGNANRHESSLVCVLELVVNFLNFSFHSVHRVEELLLDVFRVGTASSSHHSLHLAEHAAEFVLQLDQLEQSLLEDGREVEQTQGVASGRSVKNNQVKVVFVQRLQHFAEGSSLINSGNRLHDVLHERHAAFSILTTCSAEQVGEHVATLATLVSCRVNLHREEVIEVFDCSRLAGELLVEGIGQVMGRVCRDQKHLQIQTSC